MQRTALGLIALTFLLLGGGGEIFLSANPAWHTLSSYTLRSGIMLALVWLALPDLRRLPRWSGVLIVVSFVVAWYFAAQIKLLLPLAGGAVFVLLLLRPLRSSISRPPTR